MKKKVKAAIKSSKRSKTAAQEPELPSLVEAMAKLVERLESVERKMDQVLGQVSNLSSEINRGAQNVQRPQAPSHHPSHQPVQNPERSFSHGQNQNQDLRRERIMYQAICADCEKSCEVPFKPSAERPIYCKECFAIRKGGGGAAQKSGRRDSERSPQRKPEFNPRFQGQNSQSTSAAVISSNISSGKKNFARNNSAHFKKKRKY